MGLAQVGPGVSWATSRFSNAVTGRNIVSLFTIPDSFSTIEGDFSRWVGLFVDGRLKARTKPATGQKESASPGASPKAG